MNSGVPEISWWTVGLSLLPIIAAGWFYHRWCDGAKDLGIATVRMVVQLVGVGFLLVILFENPSWWIAVLVLTVMISASAWIGLRAVRQSGPGVFGVMVAALALAGLPVLVLDLGITQKGDFSYQPRLLIPLAGMVFGNAMNSMSLAAERFESEVAGGMEAMMARAKAFRAAMIPQINAFLSVGIVALPGMMTGQVLAGVSPLVAVRYQILIMAMILGSAGLTTAFYFLLTARRTALPPGGIGSTNPA